MAQIKQFIKAPNETVEFLKIGNNIFEQIEEGVYSKLNFQESINYFTFNIQPPTFKIFENKAKKLTEVKVKKMIDKNTNDENFGCL